MPNKMPLPDGARTIIDRLNSHGFSANIVGGSVRDFLVDRDIFDYDINTSATPDKIKEIFSDFRTVDTGILHGTVTVISDGTPYEVTTYRLDGDYLDSRHPESVSFTDALAEDLARRDFTVNAICYNDKDGFIDMYSGIADIEAGIIRAVGDPMLRFSEDALRILRAIRFSSQLGFEIEKMTDIALRTLAPSISKISRERILVEWKKLLAGKNAYSVISKYRDVIELAIPELKGAPMPPESSFDGRDSFVRELLLFATSDNAPLRFSRASISLRRDNLGHRLGKDTLSAIREPVPCDRADVARFLRKWGEKTLDLYLNLAQAIGIISCAGADRLSSLALSGIVYKLSQLAISGDDIIALGICGKAVGEALEYALSCVISGECENTRDELLWVIKNRK